MNGTPIHCSGPTTVTKPTIIATLPLAATSLLLPPLLLLCLSGEAAFVNAARTDHPLSHTPTTAGGDAEQWASSLVVCACAVALASVTGALCSKSGPQQEPGANTEGPGHGEKEQPKPVPSGAGAATEGPAGMTIVELDSHFHPSAVGAPKPEAAHAAIDQFVQRYAEALRDGSKDGQPLLELFAFDTEPALVPTAVAQHTDAGAAAPASPCATADESTAQQSIKERQAALFKPGAGGGVALPGMALPGMALPGMARPKAANPAPESGEGPLDEAKPLDKSETPTASRAQGVPGRRPPSRPAEPGRQLADVVNDGDSDQDSPVAAQPADELARMDMGNLMMRAYATSDRSQSLDAVQLRQALRPATAHPMDGSALVPSWTDPVGTPPHVGRDGITERIKRLPPMDYVKVDEVFYTKSDKTFMAKVEVKFVSKPKPFFVVDRFVVA